MGFPVDGVTMTEASSRVNGDHGRKCGHCGRQSRRIRGMTKRMLQHAHDEGGYGGARAGAGKIGAITTMQPVLQCAH